MTCDSTMVLQHHGSCLWFPCALVLEQVKAPDRGSLCWEVQRCCKSWFPPKQAENRPAKAERRNWSWPCGQPVGPCHNLTVA